MWDFMTGFIVGVVILLLLVSVDPVFVEYSATKQQCEDGLPADQQCRVIMTAVVRDNMNGV